MRPSARVLLGGAAVLAGVLLLFRPGRTAAPRPGSPRGAAPEKRVVGPTPQPGRADHVVRTQPPLDRAPAVARLGWGSSGDAVGRSEANESAPMGPSSFVMGPGGEAFVLDQVNARIAVVKDGRVARTIPLSADTFEDLALLPGGRFAALDRLVTGSIAVLDASGRIDHEIALAGEGVPRAGDVTSLTAREDGLWVEVDHRNLVRVADADGAATRDRRTTAGRFSADGRSFVRAKVEADRSISVTVTPRAGGSEATTRVAFPLPVLSIHALETNREGRVFVAATTIEESPEPPFDVTDVRETVVVLDASLAEVTRVEVPPKAVPEEQLRRYRMGDDGHLYLLELGPEGVVLRKITP